MNWKQLAKAVVDEVKKWAAERFVDVEQVKLLVAAETRDANDATAAELRALKTPVDELGRKVRELAAKPAPTAAVDGAAITAAVAAWFEQNPPPVPKDGTSVNLEDLEPFLQAGLAKWQLEFERNASGVLQRFLEKLRQPKDGEPGKDATPEAIRDAVAAYLAEHPVPAGKDADPVSETAIAAAVAAWLEAHPPKDGAPPSDEAIRAAAAAWFEAHPIPTPKDGEPGRAPTAAEIGAAVARHLEAHPIRDGQDATGEQVRAAVDAFMAEHPLPELDVEAVTAAALELVRSTTAKWLADHPPPAPLAPKPEEIAAAVGAYLREHPPAAGKSVTLEEVQPLFDAAFAKWALAFERGAREVLDRAIEKLEKPKDGRDGLDVTNLGVELAEDGRTLRFVLADGERRHVAVCRLPIPLDRGVFKDGVAYERGDCVTFGGSMWIAQKDDPAGRPGSSVDWRLAVKHGRDAKK